MKAHYDIKNDHIVISLGEDDGRPFNYPVIVLGVTQARQLATVLWDVDAKPDQVSPHRRSPPSL